MSFKYGTRSMQRLITCHPNLQKICHGSLERSPFDLTILEGKRPEERQNQLYADGFSKVKWPDSMHNKNPSLAVDIAPFPVEWNNALKFHVLAGIMFAVASEFDIKLRWGGDWNGNWRSDQSFIDLPHFELIDA